MKDFSKEIKAYALKNAIEFEKADVGKILPKLFQHGLEKKDIGKVMPAINSIVSEVNKASNSEREKMYSEFEKYVKEKEEKERELPELNNAKGKMVFRLAPFPSGALHIGNAKTYLLNALYAEKYNAKILLVMDDTIGSEDKQIAPEAYSLIENAFSWLDVKYEKPVIYKSDRLEIYYSYAEKLIEKNKAYVCHCLQEKLKENRANGRECECRNLPMKEQKERWKKMFDLKEGFATLRIKTSMENPNPAFRDRVLFKISDRKHPRVGNKYRVWPTLEMSWAIDDHLLGISHILRGNDLMMETEMEKHIWNIFGWKNIETVHTGLIRIGGIEDKISKSKAQKEVASGKFTGWDDPRTWSIQSLKRRGIRADSIREFVKEIGLNRQDINIPVDSLYAINRKIIDADAERYSFLEEPIETEVYNTPDIKEIEIPIHPDKDEKRKVKIDKIFISKNDFNAFKGKEIRLLHLFNIKLDEKMKGKKARADFTSVENKNISKINWVSGNVQCRVLMPSGEWISGIAESAIAKLKKDDMIQFERFAFARFDGKNGKNYDFWFAHK